MNAQTQEPAVRNHRVRVMLMLFAGVCAAGLLAAARAEHRMQQRAVKPSQVALATSAGAEYFPARFDMSSAPRDPQPGQFSLLPGE